MSYGMTQTCTRAIRQRILKVAHIALVSPRSAVLAVVGEYLPIVGIFVTSWRHLGFSSTFGNDNMRGENDKDLTTGEEEAGVPVKSTMFHNSLVSNIFANILK